MQNKIPSIPKIPEDQLAITWVQELLVIIKKQFDEIEALRREVEQLKNEVARLKGHKGKPNIMPSTLENQSSDSDERKPDGEGPTQNKRPGSDKKSKKNIPIHKEIRVKPDNIPLGAVFKGTREFDVQDIHIALHNTRYIIEEWVDSEGKAIEVQIPSLTAFPHFGGDLVRFILYQYHQCHVTQPLLLEELEEFGIQISAGQLSRILTDEELLKKFHNEKKTIFEAGIASTSYVQTDDTGARHDGQNGHCTIIGNEFFSWFESSPLKSRINFLQLLQGGKDEAVYIMNPDALTYMKSEKLPAISMEKLQSAGEKLFQSLDEWKQHLEQLGIKSSRHTRIATEAALFAGAFSKGLSRDFIILSDDAGQFNVPLLQHALCWIHAERLLQKIIPIHPQAIKDLEIVLAKFWSIYKLLKSYRKKPSSTLRTDINAGFDELCQRKTACEMLNMALERLYKNKDELLLVLDYPELPLHNNMSESDIREYVKRRKISGGTRSLAGQKARDTFTSLKKTCRKLGVSFWDFLNDRITGAGKIAQLADLIRNAAKNKQPAPQISTA